MKALARDFSNRHPGESRGPSRVAGLDSGFRRNDEAANPEAGLSGKNPNFFRVNWECADLPYAGAHFLAPQQNGSFRDFRKTLPFVCEKGAPLTAIMNFKGRAILWVGRAVPDMVRDVSNGRKKIPAAKGHYVITCIHL